MQGFPQELQTSHQLLSNLEEELGKERGALIQKYNRGGPTTNSELYGSFYPLLETLNHLENQYTAELTKFRKILQQTLQKNQAIQQQQKQQQQAQQQQAQQINNNIDVNVNDNNASSRKIATMQNVNGNYGVNGNLDDNKQQESPQQSQQQQQQAQQQQAVQTQQTIEDEMKERIAVSSLFSDQPQQRAMPTKPPVRSTNSASFPIQTQQPQQPVQSQQQQQQQPPQQQQPREQRIVTQQKPKKTLMVRSHKYKYEGRGFDIWRRNLQRPIYTSTTLKINKKFRGDEKLARNFLIQKGGMKNELIEQVTFIPKRDPNNRQNNNNQRQRGQKLSPSQIEFTIVRVRTSLENIYKCMDRITSDPEYQGKGEIIRKQNNRSKPINMNQNRSSPKLYVNNFDILDKNCHRKLTNVFLKFGELEQDIFIGRDKKQNPFAIVSFRNIRSARNCYDNNNFGKSLFFPEIDKDKDNDNNSPSSQRGGNQRYLNRKLHIEYNMNNDGNNNNRGSNRGRRSGGRGRGRGGGRNNQSRR